MKKKQESRIQDSEFSMREFGAKDRTSSRSIPSSLVD